MARHLRVEYSGAIYHVTCRMVGDWKTERTYLFKDSADRERFVDRLAERVEQYHIRLYLFVLMTNHFHLVFETPEANCSKFMQSLSTAYTVYFNLRHGRHGHLLDGRFKARLVEGDDYLLALSRYVHLNPVQVGSMKDKPIAERIEVLRAWRWSSYPSYIGECKALEFVEYAPLLAGMGGKRHEWPKRYREFVEGGLAESDDDFKMALKASPRSIGGDGFRAWIDEFYQKRVEAHARPEDVSFRHITEPLSPDEVLAVLSGIFAVDVSEFRRRQHGSVLRGVAAKCLIRYAGQSQREVAATLGVGTGSAICSQLKTLSGTLEADSRLRSLLEQAEKTLVRQKAQRTTVQRKIQ
jgi:putative transposase